MNQKSKEARQKLKKSTRKEFESMIYEAMLTPTQEKVIRLHIAERVSVDYIAERLTLSEGAVRKHLQDVYEKVARL